MGDLARNKEILNIHMHKHQWVEEVKIDTNTSCLSAHSISLQDVFLGWMSVLPLSPPSCLPKSAILQYRVCFIWNENIPLKLEISLLSLPLCCLTAGYFCFKKKKVPTKLYWYSSWKNILYSLRCYLVYSSFSVKHWLTDEQSITEYTSKCH